MDWLIPDGQFAEHALVAAVTLLATAIVVVIHYEGVVWLARRFSGRTPHPARERRAILKIIFALLGLHVAEIWAFGVGYWVLLMLPGTGFVHGIHGMDTLFDAIYLSATTYTTLGIGDLAPVGAVRLMTGMEALTGFLMVTWSASFTYLEMSRLWTTRAE
jgi:hypothetical protein